MKHGTINRLLLTVVVVEVFTLIIMVFTSLADPIIAAIGLVVGFTLYLFPPLRKLLSKLWFVGLGITVMLSLTAVVLLGGILFVGGYLSATKDFRINRIDGMATDGSCGTRCTIIVEGKGISQLRPGDRLAVYGPQAKLTSGIWSESPIAIIGVVNVGQDTAIAQALLVHEASNTDSSKRLAPLLHLELALSIGSETFLVPAFGDGYVINSGIVRILSGRNIQIGDLLVALDPQVQNNRILDHVTGKSELKVIGLGQENNVAQTVVSQGPEPAPGTVIIIKGKSLNFSSSVSPTSPFSAAPTITGQNDIDLEMVSFPLTVFLMGSDSGKSDEAPSHSIVIHQFWLSKNDVTNRQYGAFIEDGGYQNRLYWTDAGWMWRQNLQITAPAQWTESSFNGDMQPVVGVSWYEAFAFTKWLSLKTGKPYRLPTEAEWERAACGFPKRQFPWGNFWDGTLANFADRNKDFSWSDKSVDTGYKYTSPVGSYPKGATLEGLMDMAGNVWQWTQSVYRKYPYTEDVNDPSLKENRTTRGGGWGSESSSLRCTSRSPQNPGFRNFNIGFRVGRDI